MKKKHQWFFSLSSDAQKAYVKAHPRSIFAKRMLALSGPEHDKLVAEHKERYENAVARLEHFEQQLKKKEHLSETDKERLASLKASVKKWLIRLRAASTYRTARMRHEQPDVHARPAVHHRRKRSTAKASASLLAKKKKAKAKMKKMK